MRGIYFDNASTTEPFDEAIEKANQMHRGFGNPSSLHAMGLQAEREVDRSAGIISELLGVSREEILFTSGGTEANNLAVLGAAKAYSRNGRQIVTNLAEHPSVAGPVNHLETTGFYRTDVPLDRQGILDFSFLEKSIGKETVLVSIMQVNHETGIIQDIERIGKMIKKANPNAIFHVDGVQGFGKHRLNLNDVDLYSLSGHKMHGLKGIGALVAKRGVKLAPLFYGGGQQRGKRPGTENTAGIASLAVAAQICYEQMDSNLEKVSQLKNEFVRCLKTMDHVYINGFEPLASPYITNASFVGVKAEVLLNALGEKGIYVSTGAACNAKKKNRNALSGYDLPKEMADSAVRFSFSHKNTMEEIEKCFIILKEEVGFLRRFSKS